MLSQENYNELAQLMSRIMGRLPISLPFREKEQYSIDLS